MDTSIERLAAASCLECGGRGFQEHIEPDGYGSADKVHEPCSTCGSTGALVHGLRRKCERWHSMRAGDTLEEANAKLTCCRGTNQVLIPEVEVLGVLVRFDKRLRIWWSEEETQWRSASGAYGGVGKTPELAAASAICHARKV